MTTSEVAWVASRRVTAGSMVGFSAATSGKADRCGQRRAQGRDDGNDYDKRALTHVCLPRHLELQCRQAIGLAGDPH